MDINKLFKLPQLPSSSINKRKWTDPSAEALKTVKSSASARPSSRPTVEDVRDEDDNDDRRGPAVAGPSQPKAQTASVRDLDDEDEEDDGEFAPGNDADYFIEEDDEGGRFFGGGLTTQQKRILEIMNGGDDDGEKKTTAAEDLANARKQLLKFERAINKNQEMRVKFPDDPRKFIESEADLDACIKSLVVLTTNAALFYPEVVKLGIAASLCELLSHENADISSAAVELLEELTDQDVLETGEEGADDEDQGLDRSRVGQEAMASFVAVLVENQILDLVVQTLTRFNESLPDGLNDETAAITNLASDLSAVYHTLSLFENLISLQPSLADQAGKSTGLLPWLVRRITSKSRPGKGGLGPAWDQNRYYAAELLAMLLQGADGEENRKRIGDAGAIDELLGVVSQFRKKDPVGGEETEFMENLFDALCSSLSVNANKHRFLEGEGVELMVIIMREKRVARLRAIKTLDFALSGPAGSKCCEAFVEALGLKPLFSVFMGKGFLKKSEALSFTDEEHVLGIVISLFNNLASDSEPRTRLLTKFVEAEYEKVDRLIEMRESAQTRLANAQAIMEREKRDMERAGFAGLDEDEESVFEMRRLESGLFTLQLVDFILAWICMEDDGVGDHAKMLLDRRGKSLRDVVDVLIGYHESMGDDDAAQVSNGAQEDAERDLTQKEILGQLIDFLLSVTASPQ
ncbi:unnamed protein product [Tilletia laevis]|uniref:Beta-catenin-like protein 1 N-terminal domain-containing protein n=2 Tax=Tilletia TaxID=13289 RepID=A0A9N8MEQ7_9BASI|nr:hypothetical protein A4X03_0g2569 [Tilletia caries]CAD6887382.1 unnamed protein product [Tilletia caries]CAD6909455.1 unnamed protein product [Tilletia laevis]CAD6910179.1 unnamed protein product [Tilletia caries]CAD6961924.1 unnamed protein product [Tilletia laevis]